jgi:hypothetical protein
MCDRPDRRVCPNRLDRELTATQDDSHAAAWEAAARPRLAGGTGVGSNESVARYGPFALNTGEEMTVDSYRDDRRTAR